MSSSGALSVAAAVLYDGVTTSAGDLWAQLVARLGWLLRTTGALGVHTGGLLHFIRSRLLPVRGVAFLRVRGRECCAVLCCAVLCVVCACVWMWVSVRVCVCMFAVRRAS